MTTVNYRELISKKVARGCCASVRGHCLETFVLNFYSPNYKSKVFMQKESCRGKIFGKSAVFHGVFYSIMGCSFGEVANIFIISAVR